MTRPIARLAVVSVAVAAAFWLVPASVHIASWPASGPVRVAYVAPLSRLWMALAIAASASAGAAFAWRRSGRPLETLARALAPLGLLLLWVIPYLPWLPDRVPLLLVLAGPLRWLVAVVAASGVVAEGLTRAVKRIVCSFDRRALFAISFVVYALLGVRFATQVGFTGDEPHYLVIAQSLLADRDLDIANNHAQRDYRAFFPGDLPPDFLQRGRQGEIYSIHAPGLPAILLPAYAAAGAIGSVVFMALLAALTALAIFDLASIVAGRGPALVAWAAVCFTVPFVPHAWLIYPEVPGALIVAWAVLWLWKPPASLAPTALHGAALALLPWLHTKFAVFLALLTLFETIRLWPRMKHIAVLVAPIAVSGVLWLFSFYWMYGVFDPEAPYGSYTRMFVLAKNIPRGTLGLLFDQKFGLLAFSPVYILVLAGSWLMLRDSTHRWRAAGLLLTAIVFFVSTTRLYMWWGGSSAPARFLVPIVPLLAPMVATAVAALRGTSGRAWVMMTLLASLAIATIAIGSTGERLLYSHPHGVSSLLVALQGSAPLTAATPTFTEENWRAPITDLWPWFLALGVTAMLMALCVGKGLVRTASGAAVVGGLSFLAIASAAPGSWPASDRNAAAVRGQLALMHAYDPPRLRAVNLSALSRMSDAYILGMATLTVRRPLDADIRDYRVLEGPFELPEGRYHARIWFDADRAPEGDALVGVSADVTLAHAATPVTNPATLAFDLAVPVPAYVGVSNPRMAKAVRQVDIIAEALVPASVRAMPITHVVEAVDGGVAHTYMGYTDEHTYPEGGVFWTRDTQRGRIVIVTGGASTLRLILRVGPLGGPVEIEAAGKSYDVEMRPGETREVTVPIAPGTRWIDVAVRASQAFVPAEVDRTSDDLRRLGCQVRPVLSSRPSSTAPPER